MMLDSDDIEFELEPLTSQNITANRENATPNTNNKSNYSRGSIAAAIVYSIITTSVIGFGSVAYFQIRNQENDLNSKFIQLSQNFDRLQLQNTALQAEMKLNEETNVLLNQDVAHKLIETKETVHSLNRTALDRFGYVYDKIHELSNHSNADVLKQLVITEGEINNNIGKLKDHVHSQLTIISSNVTSRLQQSQQSLKTTEKLVQSQFILVQYNVSKQLLLMQQILMKTQSDLSAAVTGAQDSIHTEVETVKKNIDQYIIITNKQFAAENDFVKYQLAGTFTLLACLISLWHLTSHMRHYEKPDIQRRIMAILWMVPIYSVTSWLSLVFPNFERGLAAFRDGYEAYVVYTFIALLIAVLQDGDNYEEFIAKLTAHVIEENREYNEAVRKKLNYRPARHLVPPFPCCYEYSRVSSVAVAWLNQCRIMAMQFVIIKPTLSIIPYIIVLCGYDYELDINAPLRDNNINWSSARLYVIIAMNISVAVAFFGLLKFYHGTEKDLLWCDPWPKFLCIKGVVFMTFWQGLAIQSMSSFGLVDARAANQIQNLLICIEMMLASVAHYYIFPYHEWRQGYRKEKLQHRRVVLNDTLAVHDFITDFKNVVSPWESGAIADNHAFMDLENNTGTRGEEKGDCGDSISSQSVAVESACDSGGLPMNTWRYTVGIRTRESDSSERGCEKAYHRGLDSDDSDSGDYDNARMLSVSSETQFESKDVSTYSTHRRIFELPSGTNAAASVSYDSINSDYDMTPADTLSQRPLEYYQLGGPRPINSNLSSSIETIGSPSSSATKTSISNPNQTNQSISIQSQMELFNAHTDNISRSFEAFSEDIEPSTQSLVKTEELPYAVQLNLFNNAFVTKSGQQAPSSSTSAQPDEAMLVGQFDHYSESESV